MSRGRPFLAVVAVGAMYGCVGSLGNAGGVGNAGNAGGVGNAGNAGGSSSEIGDDSSPRTAPPTSDISTLGLGEGVGPSGVRRLTIAELDSTLGDLVGDKSRPARKFLPEESLGSFNNDYTQQVPSAVLVEGLERLADDVTLRLLADGTRRDSVVGCTPKSATARDGACMRQFINSFGRRALRRPLTTEEVDLLQAKSEPFVDREKNFYAGVEVVLRGLLQHPELNYRVEIGTAVADQPGLYKLNGYEVATRLSYLLWGSTPSDQLLDWAAQGKLDKPADVRNAAFTMSSSARTVANLDQFHALWLGYSALPHAPDLTTRMRTETAKLVERTFQGDGSWLDLFRSSDTWVDAALARHYGLGLPAGGAGWVSYGASGRQGLLSHGSFLSAIQDTTDTSPTRRGKRVREQLLCQPIPPPPPDVKADTPPQGTGSPCKWDRYAEHRAKGTSCNGCHRQMDPIGFGLENYDREGRYRTHDIDTLDGSATFGQELPQCEIKGQGELVGLGTFSGPAELSNLLVADDAFGACVATQLHRFAIGRVEQAEDQAALKEFADRFKRSGYKFRELLLGYVSSNAFGYRRAEN